MSTDSRTAKSLKNSAIAMGFYLVNLGLQFFSRKIFLEYLGTDILGLNTTAMNLLQFLNLAELGISSAVGFTLYKPLHDNDQTTINEIVTLQGHLYRRIAYLIIAGAIVLMCFFPLIFKKISLPLWYAYASFGVLLFSALLGYFFNYRQIVLSANQQDYKILYSYKSVMLVKVGAQMAAVYYLPHGYVWWLVFEAIFSVIATIALTWMTNRTFPYLSNTNHSFKELRQKYSEFTTKIKQVFFHKIGGFALTQSSPLIIYAFTSLTTVALYGNYLIIISGIQLFVSSIFNSTLAGIGHLVAEGNNEKIKNVFIQLFGVRFVIVTTVCFSTYLLIQQLVTLWIGESYLLSPDTVILMIALLYISLFRYSVDGFKVAYGLFQDIYAPLIESLLNIGLSIWFGYLWGLNGVLLGVLISQFILTTCWAPYFLLTNTNFLTVKRYLLLYLNHLLVLSVASIIWYHCCYLNFICLNNSWDNFIKNCLLISITFGTTVTLAIFIINKPFKQLFRKIFLQLIKR